MREIIKITKSMQRIKIHLAGIHNRIQRIGSYAHSWLTPQSNECLICHKKCGLLPSEYGLCQSCLEQVPWIYQVYCEICGRYEQCFDCRRRRHHYFQFNRSAVRYDATMKRWLAQYKYRQNEKLNSLFITMLSHAYERMLKELYYVYGGKSDGKSGGKSSRMRFQIHAITYIPLSEERLEERGFNQAEQLASGIATRFNLPLIPLLSRVRHTDKQSYKTRFERLQDLQNAFSVHEAGLEAIRAIQNNLIEARTQPVNIILIDDVYTTGSTLHQCSKVLVTATPPNAVRIYGLTLAR